ncbi:hypothetical protein ACFFLM_18115 [Deinococcus oregonensis]|uniref:Uncharacterized protein n=1 Tax=Deinococcus oregonensis TaxID=1805970 RepID=A0ABV6B4J6_9DEIO
MNRATIEVIKLGTLVQLRPLGGHLRRVPAPSTAFAGRDHNLLLLLVTHLTPTQEPTLPFRARTSTSPRRWGSSALAPTAATST